MYMYMYMYVLIQENLSLKMGHAQLEGEVQRLRDELQRRETALHRVEAQSASQARELSVALQELGQLRARVVEEREAEEEGEEEGEGEGEEGEGEEGESSSEDGLADPVQEESTHKVVCMCACACVCVCGGVGVCRWVSPTRAPSGALYMYM